MDQPKEKIKPLKALTGLRWIAAFVVFVQHVLGNFSLPKPELWLGSTAVAFFFVLSGFILTYVYSGRMLGKPGEVQDKGKRKKVIRKFFFTRWARIWPLHFVCLLISMFALSQWWLTFEDGWATTKFFTNLTLMQSWVAESKWVFSFNGVSWSISTEAFFYLVFPLFLIGGQRKFWVKFAALYAVVIGLLLAVNYCANVPALAGRFDFDRIPHANPLMRLPEFCVGMAIGFLYLNRTPAAQRSVTRDTIWELAAVGLVVGWHCLLLWTNTAGAIKSLGWTSIGLAHWVHITLSVWTFAFLIYVFARTQGLLARAIGSQPMVFLGEISFAFYLIHYIVIGYVDRFLVQDTTLSPLAIVTCVFMLCLAFSILLYKIVEMPTKTALLSLFSGRFGESMSGFANAIGNYVRTPSFAVVVVMIAIPMLAFSLNPTPLDPGMMSQTIVASSPQAQKNIDFDGKVKLLGYGIEEAPEGILIHMVWVKLAEFEQRRFIHICNASQEITSQGPLNPTVFSRAQLNQPFVDTALVNFNQLGDGYSIGVGFFHPDTGLMKVSNGPRSMYNQRLDLLSPNQIAVCLQTQSTETRSAAASQGNATRHR